MDRLDVLFAKLYRLRATLRHVLSRDGGAIFNVPGSGSAVTVERELLSALDRGLVRLRLENGRLIDKRQSDTPTGFPSYPADKVQVELTSAGGVLWEKRASPLWSYFIDEGEPQVIRGNVWILFEAKSPTWLDCVDQTLRRFGFFRTNQRRKFVKRRWQPVYWKQFKLGYSLAIDTGHRVDSALGERFLQGIAMADTRLADTFSVLSGVWDARWVSSFR